MLLFSPEKKLNLHCLNSSILGSGLCFDILCSPAQENDSPESWILSVPLLRYKTRVSCICISKHKKMKGHKDVSFWLLLFPKSRKRFARSLGSFFVCSAFFFVPMSLPPQENYCLYSLILSLLFLQQKPARVLATTSPNTR